LPFIIKLLFYSSLKPTAMQKNMTLMNFVRGYDVTGHENFIKDELNWALSKVNTKLTHALFIPYAYDGTDYDTYFHEISLIFNDIRMKLVDIRDGDSAELLKEAHMIIVCGGDIMLLKKSLDQIMVDGVDAYSFIRKIVENGVPYMGWNEGSEISSKVYFKPPADAQPFGFGLSPYQIICNFVESPSSSTAIANFLQSQSDIRRVIYQVARPKTRSTIRLEEAGSAMLDSISGDPSLVKCYELVDGQVVETFIE
jgi:hypothetical protein